MAIASLPLMLAFSSIAKEVMVSFFRYLEAGWGKDKALQQAQLDFLDNPKNIEYQHPYYWAGFVLIGDALPLSQFQGNSSFWRWGILFLLFILLFFVLRKRFR